jgi:hypothetical protein
MEEKREWAWQALFYGRMRNLDGTLEARASATRMEIEGQQSSLRVCAFATRYRYGEAVISGMI